MLDVEDDNISFKIKTNVELYKIILDFFLVHIFYGKEPKNLKLML